MNQKILQKAFSDVSLESKRHIIKIEEEEQEEEEVKQVKCDCCCLEEEEEVKQVKCDCCCLEEACTVKYIEKVKDLYSGKWVCGLCAEVVTERCRKHSPGDIRMQEALDWHRGICETFNSTTRINPKLAFSLSMREIAKRSSQNRRPNSSVGSTIVRSISCDPRLET